jgi:Ca2+-binding EF-hand superfamily protein
LDSNSDGKIDLAEMRAGLQFYAYGTLPLGVGGNSVEAVFKRADKNGDGLVDRAEFLAAVKEDLQTIHLKPKQMGLKY